MILLFFNAESFGAKDYAAIAAAILGLVTLIKGIVEYTKAQQWKKAEFISKEVKEFYAAPVVIRALKFIDWDAGKIALLPNEIPNKSFLEFNNESLIIGLRHHNEGNDRYTHDEEKIREIVDGLLDKLSLFQHYIDGGLFSVVELKGYLKYWTDIMFDPNNGRYAKAEFRQALKKYIYDYKFNDLIKLVKGMGYDFNPPQILIKQ